SAEDGSSPSPYAEGRAPAPQPAPASGDGGPAAPLAQPPAAPLAQSLFGEATPSAAHPPRTTMVDAKQQSKTRPPNPSPPPLPAAGSAHCDRKPSRLLGHTESEAMEKPRALTEAGAQTIPRPLVEQGAQTYISRIADLLEEGADTSKVVGTQTDSPDVMQVEISKRLAWARAQRQETLHQILGTGGASGGHVEYPRESAEADQLVVELAKLGMDRRALKSLVEPIEVVDVAVQSGVEVAGSLDPIFRWLKLNLLQRQNAWLYCLPSEVSALEGFPNIPGARLEKLLVDFERFLEEILSRPLPAKSAARSALRARYRARSDSPCSRRNRSGSPPPGRGSLLGGRESWRRSNAVEPYEYPVGFLSSGFDGEQEVANMVLVPGPLPRPPAARGLPRHDGRRHCPQGALAAAGPLPARTGGHGRQHDPRASAGLEGGAAHGAAARGGSCGAPRAHPGGLGLRRVRQPPRGDGPGVHGRPVLRVLLGSLPDVAHVARRRHRPGRPKSMADRASVLPRDPLCRASFSGGRHAECSLFP
ncbi:unnamed protein product, partial [Prorocentrum cordatum]